MPAILCPRCHKLINSEAPRCHHCGLVRPGMFGLAQRLRQLGLQADFPHLITIVCVAAYVVSLLLDPGAILRPSGGFMNILAPGNRAVFDAGATGIIPVQQYVVYDFKQGFQVIREIIV